MRYIWQKGICFVICVCVLLGGVSFWGVPVGAVATEEGMMLEREEVIDLEEESAILEEKGELLELWEDKERLSKWVFALGMFWFTGNYMKWMKKAFAVKK